MATGQHSSVLFSGRGILSESQGPVWMIGTASEHHVIYQYSLVGAQDHYMGLIQTETVSVTLLSNANLTTFAQPYYQPVPLPPSPFKSNSKYSDPTLGSHVKAAWGPPCAKELRHHSLRFVFPFSKMYVCIVDIHFS